MVEEVSEKAQPKISPLAVMRIKMMSAWVKVVGVFFMLTAFAFLIFTGVMIFINGGNEKVLLMALLVGLFGFFGIVLFNSGRRMKAYSESYSEEDIEKAMNLQNTYWAAVGILSILGMFGIIYWIGFMIYTLTKYI